MENRFSFPNTSEKHEYLNVIKDTILNAEERIKEEQERVGNPWYRCMNTVLHIVHGNLELASFEDCIISTDAYEKISTTVWDIDKEVKKEGVEIEKDKQNELLGKLRQILNYLP